ncbi:Ni/Fe hydrogenase subunit alpha [Methanopyrus kandleri]|uniref:Coenzyme F420-reducing hydrogenase, alpha subunit n=2 Tax=Methanopyrus kandleri TaxID=2320 RepID=Q8TYW3_METKA|nr:Ni/Fe hydrogenase subunit alpha [Methanopyrus kandleri]AAM01395.1 Coenzyme F420-reducing hydrogenase, alpha subunit [Methanopyrus kandleri AV19]HII70681.1 Ni/Fe hydrogenase subunit alpha [Methanopyrus kandleri]
MAEIKIHPLTRVEGHGEVIIEVEDGEVTDVKFAVLAVRGFEKFVQGRPAEDVPYIVSRICGICQTAHHLAACKAVDACFDAEPPEGGHKIRWLMHIGNMIHSHALHFYFLAAPDYVVGPDADPLQRNVVKIVKDDPEVGKIAIELRRYGQDIVEATGGKAIHPVTGIPGGVSSPVDPESRDDLLNRAEEMIEMAYEGAKVGIEAIKETLEEYREKHDIDLLETLGNIETYHMGLVSDGDKHEFYDGEVKVVDPNGEEVTRFEPQEYQDVIAERTIEYSYVKHPYLKDVGYPDGIYRVGPGARLNVCSEMKTERAQELYEEYVDEFGECVNYSLTINWARLVELVAACEEAKMLLEDDVITEEDECKEDYEPKAGEGVGIVEAPRGTLIHHYVTDDEGRVKEANLIVATTHNVPAIELALKETAKKLEDEIVELA